VGPFKELLGRASNGTRVALREVVFVQNGSDLLPILMIVPRAVRR